jgi:large subunit ribosomal protein L19
MAKDTEKKADKADKADKKGAGEKKAAAKALVKKELTPEEKAAHDAKVAEYAKLPPVQRINAETLLDLPSPAFKVGDSVKVYVKIREGDKERLQAFNGTVIAKDNGDGVSSTFTVRRFAFGVTVEKVFPTHSPYIDRVEVERSAKVRRAKLYYLRELNGKKARLREE